MNEKYINEALGCISVHDLDDALSYKKPHISYKSFAVIAAALALAVGAGTFFLLKGNSNKLPIADGGPISTPSSEKGIYTGGNDGSASLDPTGIFTRTGTAYTDEQVKELIDREKDIIAHYITSETKDIDGEIRIAVKGYNYAQANGNTIALDYLTLPVFTEDNRIVGEVVLFSYDGELHYNVAAGGPSWARITDIISKHQSDKFAYVYVGELNEVMISEDGTVYNMRADGDDPLAGIEDRYQKYAQQENTFCLADCVKEKEYIAVKLG